MPSSKRGHCCASVQESGLCIWAQGCKVPVFGQTQGLSPGRAGLERGARGASGERTRARTAPGLQLRQRLRQHLRQQRRQQQRRQQRQKQKQTDTLEHFLFLSFFLFLSLFLFLSPSRCRAPFSRGPLPGVPPLSPPPFPLPGRAMLPARPRPRAGLPRARPRGRVQSPPRPRLLPGPAGDTGGAAAPAASAAASPARAPPLGSAAAGPEPPVPRSSERTPGHGRPGAAEGRSGAGAGPGPSAESRVPPAGKGQEALQERHRLGSLLERRRAATVPRLASVQEEEEEGPGAFPAQDNEEVVSVHPPQEDAALDRTQKQESSHGLFCRAVQTLRRRLRLGRTKTGGTGTEGTAQPDSRPGQLRAEAAAGSVPSELAAASEQDTAQGRVEADMALTKGTATTDTQAQGMPETQAMPTLTGTPAPTLEGFQKGAASPQQVPAMVRDILLRLASCVTVDAELQMEILSLVEEHPAQVVMSLLRCAPTCDRAAALMWRAMGTLGVAAQEVLPALLSAMEEQPPHSGFSCGDNEAVLALAATLVLWRITPMCEWHCAILLHSPQLLVALFLQIVTMTEQMPGDVETRSFWRACQKEHSLPCQPNRFAVQTMKALLSQLGFGKNLLASEQKQLWDTLLCANTQHYAAGLLAREMRRGLSPLCPFMASHLLSLLMGRQHRWNLPALAFFVGLLECLDLSKHGASALLVVSRQLPSQCRDRLRLALRGLVVLSQERSLGEGIRGLYPHLVQQLADPDADVLWMSLCVLRHMLRDKDHLLPFTALKLAEPLLPHFENDNSLVQLLSIQLFCKVMELVVEEGKELLRTIVNQSLLPLFLHWHDENVRVAKASGQALLCAARFLRRRDLKELLTEERRMKFAESLLLQDESRAAEHLRWALPHLRSPQRPLREAAVRFIGLAGVLMMGQKEELQVLTEALQALKEDESPSCMSKLLQMTFERRSAGLCSSAGSDVPASIRDFQRPLEMGAPAEQDGPAGAPGTALAAQS